MDRRSALQQIALLTGGIAFVPSCSFDADRVSVALNNLKIKVRQEKLLAEIVETIIPATDIPGAKALNVHHFVLVMADDCLDKSEQATFMNGLEQFIPYVSKQYDQSFLKSNQEAREALLSHIIADEPTITEEAELDPEAVKAFLSFTKRYTLQGYMNSQYMLTEVFPYQLVPGFFKGCAPVADVKMM